MNVLMDSLSPPFRPLTTGAWCLDAALFFDGERLWRNQTISVRDGRIAAITPVERITDSALPRFATSACVVPGFFDIQVNGAAGLMFNSAPSAQTLRTIGEALAQHGTRAWLPTFISDTPEKMAMAAQAIEACIGHFGVVGVHFEGPHLSRARRGAHAAQFLHPLSDHTVALLTRLRQQNIPVLVTLAPEEQPAGTIARLCRIGVTVSLGHTAADAAQIASALAEGATCFTHLFNGMTPMHSREPGVVGAALDSTAWCGLIADGHHVADTVLRIAVRAHAAPDRMVLVSDAMATLYGPSEFDLYGETIRVHDGRLVNRAGSLAGAHLDLAQAVHRLIVRVGIDPEKALRMATRNPAQLMGLDAVIGGLRPGMPASMVLLDHDWNVCSDS
jgi:N-acetylglucosamine-6-phosphate deacetylase